ncbi:hypothetical protein GCM10027569_52330 [Flindersiella endophytica]
MDGPVSAIGSRAVATSVVVGEVGAGDGSSRVQPGAAERGETARVRTGRDRIRVCAIDPRGAAAGSQVLRDVAGSL